ncbi:hypothetical protein BDZ91DRAFT_666551, partial [Kalaharituber pfeilii]
IAESMEMLFAWLSPLEPQKRHQDVRSSRIANTGNWILQTDQFQSWVKGEGSSHSSQVLGCYGIPGAGKTVLTSLVIDYMSTITARPRTSITYLYCDYRDQEEQDLIHIIGTFIKQLVLQFISTGAQLPDLVHESFKSNQQSRKRLELGQAIKILKEFFQLLDHAFIFVDALDELQDETRIGFLNVANEILHFQATSSANKYTNSPGAVHLFFTARPHIRHHVNRYFGCEVATLRIVAQEDDIQTYLAHRIDCDYKDAMNSRLKTEILEILPQKSEGMYVHPRRTLCI